MRKHHNTIISRLVTLVFLLSQVFFLQAQCDDNIANFTLLGRLQNSTYYLSNAPAQPSQAQSIAISLDANLVSINSQGENDFIQSMIDEMVYIGLNDASSEGTLRWASNEAVTYTNYDNCNFCNENDAENDYALMHPWNGGWSFMNRWSSRGFIIEKTCDDSGGGSGGGNNNCSIENISGFDFLGDFENSNYYLSQGETTAANANSIASSYRGYLVNIGSLAENQFLEGKFDEMVHIGLNDADNEGQLRWAGGTNSTFRNIDNNCGFCNDNDAENDYVLMHPWNGEWSFTNRWSQRRYIMEVPCEDDGGSSLSYENCPANRVVQLQPGQTRTIVNWTPPTLFNTCFVGIESNIQTSGPINGTDLPAGNYTVQYAASNDCNDEAVCQFTIEVRAHDNGGNGNLSFLNCPTDRTIQIPEGQSTAFVNWTPPSVSSSCNLGGLSLGLISGPNNNTYLGEGQYEIQYRASNNCGDMIMCEFTISVISSDNTSSLAAFCPITQEIEIPLGESTQAIELVQPDVENVCDISGYNLEQIAGPTAGTQVSAGTYTITYRITNNCNDVAFCSYNVIVFNEILTTLEYANCPSNIVIQIPENQSTTVVNWTPPSLVTNCASGIASNVITAGPDNNSSLGPGEYVVRYQAMNNCGDFAFCRFDIDILATESNSSLTVECPGDQSFTVNSPPLPPVALWFFENPTFTNTCTADDGRVSVSGPGPFNQGSSLSVGNFTPTFTAINACGDTATCSWNVTVNPFVVVPGPSSLEIECPEVQTFVIPEGQSTVRVLYVGASVTNVCNLGNHSSQLIEGLQSNTDVAAGTYTARYRVTNPCGDVEECTLEIVVVNESTGGNVDYTANDQVTPYTGLFRPGTNVGYNPPWTDEEMADLAAGNPALGVEGIGARSMRPGLFDVITAVWGYDFRLDTYKHYNSLGLDDLTMIVGFPADWHRDQTDYCGNGFNSSMFRNLYTDIWDDGTDGTPYNDENFYAAYLYEVVSRYGEYVKFWEIWNEPGFDLTGNRGWRPPGDPAGNWWDNDPDPCEYILRAPIEHYVRTLRISWEIIKTLQPDDYVTVAGVGFTSFLDAILRNTDDPNTDGAITSEHPLRGGAYFDVMGFHSYPDIDGSVYEFDNSGQRIWHRHSDRAAQGIKQTMDDYTDILDNYGYGNQHPQKEWIITEINVPRRPFRPDAMSGGEEMQVNYIIKAVAVAMQNDVTQMHVYNLGDRTTEANAVTEFDLYGLHQRLTDTEAYTQVRNLEATAYRSAADFVWGSTYDANRTSQMNLPSNLDGVALSLPNGRYKYILWAKTTIDQSEVANGTYSFPASFGYGQVFQRTWNFSETDQVVGISSNNINLTGRPIFITETADDSELQTRLSDEAKHHLSVYDILPNPAVDEIKLVLESKESDNYLIQIYDATGKLMEQRTTFLQRGFSDERFDISNYVHGMYFVVIQGSQMRSTKVKFIKGEK